jgi:hypothetical protein
MDYRLVAVVMVLALMISGAFAYSGFSGYNRYYYTDNYVPTVYYAAPAYVYSYPTYAYTPTYYGSYYPTYVVTNYVAPVSYYSAPMAYYPSRSYSGASIYYNSDDSWGFSFGRGTVCGYYGYC